MNGNYFRILRTKSSWRKRKSSREREKLTYQIFLLKKLVSDLSLLTLVKSLIWRYQVLTGKAVTEEWFI